MPRWFSFPFLFIVWLVLYILVTVIVHQRDSATIDISGNSIQESNLLTERKFHSPRVDIIITVKTDIKILQQCVESLIRNAPDRNLLRQRIIFVDDGSAPDTILYEHSLCSKNSDLYICLETSARGYTHAVVQGIEYGANDTSAYDALVLLNSDTIVTTGWLLVLYKSLMFNLNDKVMLVGPISNAASYQSVPQLRSQNEQGGADWSTNPLPHGMNIDLLAGKVAHLAAQPGAVHEIPLMILNGFCYMFKRELISKIGNFDKVNFPSGYGEEVDFSIRATKAGFEGRIVTSSYVYHKKTSSFKSVEKESLKKSSRQTLVKLYGKNIFSEFDKHSLHMPDMQPVRRGIQEYYDSFSAAYTDAQLPGSILFALHSFGFSGGIISILSEAYQMRRCGVNVSISVPQKAAGGNPLAVARAVLPEASEEEIRALVIIHSGDNVESKPLSYEFVALASTFDIVVATYCKTMAGVLAVVEKNPNILLGYYAQDYEPWFWNSPFESDPHNHHYLQAKASYEVNRKTAFIICKTEWTCRMIESNHAIGVNKVEPSMNHQLYWPNNTLLAQKLSKTFEGHDRFHVVAMVRPTTSRRNPMNTLDLLLRLAYNFQGKVEITICGCQDAALASTFSSLVKMKGEAPHRTLAVLGGPNVHRVAVVKDRESMADMLRASDIFIDTSWWQAFGRSGMEAMACGCISVMPLTGAADEICGKNRTNCLVHDGNDIEGYYSKVVSLLKDDSLRKQLILNGMRRSWDFTLEGSAMSMAAVLKRGLFNHRNAKSSAVERLSDGRSVVGRRYQQAPLTRRND